jgi:ABC-type amino acid transport substrate-binding protein
MQSEKIFRIKLKRLIYCLFIFSFILLSGTSFADSEELSIATIQVAPFGFFTEDEKSTGLLYDMANLIAEAAGFSYVNRIVPFARMIAELESGESDFSIFFLSKKNEKAALQVAPLFPIENVILGLKGTTIKSLEELHGKTVAIVRGARYDDAFDADTAIIKYETKDYHHSVRMVIHKRLEAMIGPKIGLLFTAKQMGSSADSFGEPLVLNTKDAWLQFSRKKADKKKMDRLKAASEQLLKDNTISGLIDKYVR